MKYLFILICISIYSDTYGNIRTWDGGVSNEWGEPDNWIPRGLPEDSDSVYISGDNVILDISDDIDWLQLTNATLTINVGKSLTLITNFQYTNELLLFGQSRINNNGSLFVESGTNRAILLKEGSEIHNGGLIEVSESNDDGIEIRDSSRLMNHGMISIRSCINEAMTNRGLFHNLGHVFIDNTSGTGQTDYGYSNFGETVNDGKITISNITRGVSNWGSFINNDSMIISHIQNTAFDDRDSTINQGVILISDCLDNGIWVSSNAEFLNSGKIIMENVAFDNLGTCGSFINEDTITIINGGAVGVIIDAGGTFTNNEFGLVDIRSAREGIENYDMFINNGNIKIANTTSIALRNEGMFENNMDSQLSITMSQSDGIYNEGIFNCIQSSIDIQMANRDGINNREGVIDIDPLTHIEMSGIGQNPLINEVGAVLNIMGTISFNN